MDCPKIENTYVNSSEKLRKDDKVHKAVVVRKTSEMTINKCLGNSENKRIFFFFGLIVYCMDHKIVNNVAEEILYFSHTLFINKFFG